LNLIDATKTAYLNRLDARRERSRLKRHIIFGLIFGWIMTLVGSYAYFLIPHSNGRIWGTLAVTGCCFLALAVLIPTVFAWPEWVMHSIGNRIFSLFFTLLLALQYVVAFIPLGLILRWRRRYTLDRWDDTLPGNETSWVEFKPALAKLKEEHSSRVGMLGPVRVVAYFIKQGHVLAIPLLMLMMLLGLIFLFVKSSVIAPFIYTLF
jgi:hypothetical protein